MDDNEFKEQLYLEKIYQCWTNLQYIKECDQTEKICLKAIRRQGKALRYVKNKTYELCLIAVKQNGNALQFVKNQTEEICLEAVKQCKYVLRYIRDKRLKYV